MMKSSLHFVLRKLTGKNTACPLDTNFTFLHNAKHSYLETLL